VLKMLDSEISNLTTILSEIQAVLAPITAAVYCCCESKKDLNYLA
jgi:hypothetical protein